MGVYIKGMEMPKHCLDCPFMVSRDNDDCILQSEKENAFCTSWEDMKSRCPLVPVPPHGRLIDGDVAEAICFTDEDADGGKDFIDGILYATDFISQQPTVIEAEGE